MEDRGGDTGRSRSDSKLAGEKRTSGELGEKSEVARKKIKMRNLESVLSPLLKKHESKHDNKRATSVGFGLDLNAQDDSSVNQEPIPHSERS
ncbi:hypothetical protein D5086_033362 [Populus alba]|uniref:Uncharacterized protein n=1 Tax=Populus alba TaxID=43335 RepID=A0ACC4AGP8_POPAL